MRSRRSIIGKHRFALARLTLAVIGLAISSAQAQTYSVVYSFLGIPDRASPYIGGVIPNSAGALYANTYAGDISDNAIVSVFGATGQEAVLYSLIGGPPPANPSLGVIRDTAGNLYGTTSDGGSSGDGVVFKIDASGSQFLLYTFCSDSGCSDGANPSGGLIRDDSGNLYGTTTSGGAYGYGTVFSISSSGKETVLYSFSGGADGAHPSSGVIRDIARNLYGATVNGGSSDDGVVFKIDASGSQTLLYTFCSQPVCTDGANPSGGLIRDASGNLYGTTTSGGAYGYGTVFSVSGTGKETVLYSFVGGANGANPSFGVIRDDAGNFYGTTTYGGTGNRDCSGNGSNCGTVFELSSTGTETVLYSFHGGLDGGTPNRALIRDVSGNLYGTTMYGGAFGHGTVFKLAVPNATSTTTTLSSSPNPSIDGQSVLFSATVTSRIGSPPNGETVGLKQGTKSLGTGTISSGTATFSTSTLGVGSKSVTAVYGGDANFAASTSEAVVQVVAKAESTTSLSSSLNPSTFGQSVTLTATVAPEFSGTPTGTVSFKNGTVSLRRVTLSGGLASYTTTELAVGTTSIMAVYNGSSSFTPSMSTALSQVVNRASTISTLVSSLNPSSYGQAVTFTAGIVPEFGGTVTGTVTFRDGTNTLGTVTVNGESAEFTDSTLAMGTHTITATYNGSTSFTPSMSAALSQVVSQTNTTTLALVQAGYAGDASGCNGNLSCTISTTVGVTKLSQAFGANHIITLFIGGEGTNQFPVPGTPSCNSGCGTWTHISGGKVVSASGTNTTSGNYCAVQDLNSAGHHFFSDCWVVLVSASGATGIKVPLADSSGASDITNMDLFVAEYSCSGTCNPSIDTQAALVYPGNGASAGCTSCGGPSMTLGGENDLVVQTAVFEENCGTGCAVMNYKLQSWDTNSQNATAYGLDFSSTPQAVWPQSPKGGGIFAAFAINLGAGQQEVTSALRQVQTKKLFRPQLPD